MDTNARAPAPTGSPTPSPNDHLRLLVELLRPGGIELGRRWVAALMMVPEASREQVVAAVEARIVSEFGAPGQAGGQGGGAWPVDGSGGPVRGGGPRRPPSLLTSVGTPSQREGFVERVETTYEVVEEKAPAPKPQRRRKAGS